MRRWPVIAALLVVLLVATGCSASDPGRPGKPRAVAGEVAGRLLIVGGPMRPDGRTRRQGSAGTVSFRGAGGCVVTVRAGRAGWFRIRLSAGRYRAAGFIPALAAPGRAHGRRRPCSVPATVLVRHGRVRRVTLICPVT